ncbi:MAG: hypothetical protein JWR26_3444 [Pedosphaera sp.]|nr:hypothetical protein [Pedosphaera sp.]
MNSKTNIKRQPQTMPVSRLPDPIHDIDDLMRRTTLETKRSILKKLSTRINQEGCFCS